MHSAAVLAHEHIRNPFDENVSDPFKTRTQMQRTITKLINL